MAMRWRRPTVETKFHIDMEWWRQSNRDIHVYMREMLCDECRADFADDFRNVGELDWVDEKTGEIHCVDGLWHSVRTCCSVRADYITPNTSLVDAIFRAFLANGNEPLSMNEVYELLDRRPPATWLRILTAGPVYMGIRPVS